MLKPNDGRDGRDGQVPRETTKEVDMRRTISILTATVAVAAVAVSTVAIAANAAGTNLFARVDLTGTLISGNGVAAVTHLGPGQYEVTFTSDVTQCAYVATTENAYSQAITVFTAGGHLNAQGVYVETKNQGGGLTDGPFDLVVDCATAGMQFAVVGYSGRLVRATPGTSLADLGFGRYNVTFPSSVAACAYLATVGDPANGLVYSPAGVYTGSGPDTKAVYIETKNPGGGLTSGIPFHLVAICPSTSRAFVGVVKPTGIIARGSPLTSSFKAATGSFVEVTNGPVAQRCAAIATRGSFNREVPFNPSTVEIVPGPAPNTVGIQVRELLFFGGNPADEAFHFAVTC
jgi:hypothetical protein